MKILLVNKFFYIAGGAETYFFNLRDLLTRNGHQVIDFSMNDQRNFDSAQKSYFINQIDFNNNQKAFSKEAHILYSLEAKKKLEELIKKEKPEIAHLHNWYYHLSPSILGVLKKYKIPIVQTLHDYKIVCPNTRLYVNGKVCEKCKRHKYYQAVFNKCVHNSFLPSLGACIEQYWYKSYLKFVNDVDVYISPSKYFINKCQEWGVKNKIYHIPNYINFEKYQPSFTLDDYILFVGNLDPYKGIMTLIEAIKSMPEVKLKIIGTGELKDKILELGLNNVQLLGRLPHEKVLEYLKNAQFTVVPSEMHDNFPFAVLESMAMGKPSIGSDLGGIPELILNGETGYIFKYKNSDQLKQLIQKLYNNKEEIERMGRNARRIVEQKYTQENHYRSLIEIYNSLMQPSAISHKFTADN